MANISVELSGRAVTKIAQILADENSDTLLRVSIEGGGCSGFQYKYQLTAEREADDLVIEKDGARVVIDPVSLEFLQGAQIDFVNALIGESFQIRNPNAVSGCGCGVSFSV